jgi:hypothetical protein
MSNNNTPAVPNLPLPQDQFSKLYLAQLTNVLRLYFNQLNGSCQQNINDTNSNSVMIWLDMNNG